VGQQDLFAHDRRRKPLEGTGHKQRGGVSREIWEKNPSPIPKKHVSPRRETFGSPSKGTSKWGKKGTIGKKTRSAKRDAGPRSNLGKISENEVTPYPLNNKKVGREEKGKPSVGGCPI